MKGSAFQTAFLELILHGTPIPGIADNAAASPLTVLWLSLHTNDPSIGGVQTTAEAYYSGYTRMSLPRSASGWTIASNMALLAFNVTFPAAVDGAAQNLQYFGVGTAQSGPGKLLWAGDFAPTISIYPGKTVVPILTTDTQITEY